MEEQYGLQAAYIVIALALSTTIVVKSFTDYILRRKMLEMGYLDEKSNRKLGSSFLNDHFSALKWGLITLFAGLGLVLLAFMDFSSNSSLPYGVLLIFISVGFLIYYYVMRKQERFPAGKTRDDA